MFITGTVGSSAPQPLSPPRSSVALRAAPQALPGALRRGLSGRGPGMSWDEVSGGNIHVLCCVMSSKCCVVVLCVDHDIWIRMYYHDIRQY
jgi:hypothetical protein